MAMGGFMTRLFVMDVCSGDGEIFNPATSECKCWAGHADKN